MIEDFNVFIFYYKVGEFALESGSLYYVIIDPVIIAAPWLTEYDRMVLEPMFFEPVFCDLPVIFGPGGEKADDMPLFMPAVDHLERIRIGQTGRHSLRLLVWNVITNGTVDVYQKIFEITGQLGADRLSA